MNPARRTGIIFLLILHKNGTGEQETDMNREKKRQALATLEEMYPEAKAELVFSNPYEMMVATILSAQCTDRQVNLPLQTAL